MMSKSIEALGKGKPIFWHDYSKYEIGMYKDYFKIITSNLDVRYSDLSKLNRRNESIVLPFYKEPKYTIIEQSRTQTIYNWFQCFTPETLKKEFTDCSFSIEEILGDVAGSPYNSEGTEFAIIAKKKK